MKIAVRYPIRFQALPQRCGRRRDVLVSFPHEQDVPEISTSETETVFDAHGVKGARVITHGGRIFRRVGKPGEEACALATDTAFRKEPARGNPWFFALHGDNLAEMPPLAGSLENLAVHRLYLEGDGREREDECWPLQQIYNGNASLRESRDRFRFEDIEGKLSDVDWDQFSLARSEHDREAGKLLLVNGVLWVETPPPAICATHAGYGTTSRMDLELVFLPDWPDARLDRQYFPLSGLDEAMEYAESANRITAAGGKNRVDDYTGGEGWMTGDTSLLEFDHPSYSVASNTLVLAGDVARWLRKSPELEERTGAERADTVRRVAAAARAAGTDISAWPDLFSEVDAVTEAWLLTGRKPGWGKIPQKRHAFGTFLCERARSLAEGREIGLALDVHRGMGA